MLFDDKPYPPTFGQLSSKSDVALLKIWQKMLILGPFLTLISYNPGIKNFFQKSAWNIFFTLIKIQLCAKFQKNLMRGFLDMVLRTHAHTRAQP